MNLIVSVDYCGPIKINSINWCLMQKMFFILPDVQQLNIETNWSIVQTSPYPIKNSWLIYFMLYIRICLRCHHHRFCHLRKGWSVDEFHNIQVWNLILMAHHRMTVGNYPGPGYHLNRIKLKILLSKNNASQPKDDIYIKSTRLEKFHCLLSPGT